jgi:hypothetical protein
MNRSRSAPFSVCSWCWMLKYRTACKSSDTRYRDHAVGTRAWTWSIKPGREVRGYTRVGEWMQWSRRKRHGNTQDVVEGVWGSLLDVSMSALLSVYAVISQMSAAVGSEWSNWVVGVGGRLAAEFVAVVVGTASRGAHIRSNWLHECLWLLCACIYS